MELYNFTVVSAARNINNDRSMWHETSERDFVVLLAILHRNTALRLRNDDSKFKEQKQT